MKKILIIIFIVILCIIFLSTTRNLTFVESSIKDISLFANKIIDMPISYISDNIKEINNKNDIYEKYKNLEKKYNDLLLEYNKYEITKKELDNLKDNLNIKDSLLDYDIVDAYVINRNIGYFYQNLTINKGSNDNIKEGMAVINSKGLIGTITKVTKTSSVVDLLIHDPKLSVSFDNNYGILNNYDNKYLIVEGMNVEIKKGTKVYTTGMDDKVPAGLIIGYIEKSITDKNEISKKIYVKSYVNFNNIDYVMVLK